MREFSFVFLFPFFHFLQHTTNCFQLIIYIPLGRLSPSISCVCFAKRKKCSTISTFFHNRQCFARRYGPLERRRAGVGKEMCVASVLASLAGSNLELASNGIRTVAHELMATDEIVEFSIISHSRRPAPRARAARSTVPSVLGDD